MSSKGLVRDIPVALSLAFVRASLPAHLCCTQNSFCCLKWCFPALEKTSYWDYIYYCCICQWFWNQMLPCISLSLVYFLSAPQFLGHFYSQNEWRFKLTTPLRLALLQNLSLPIFLPCTAAGWHQLIWKQHMLSSSLECGSCMLQSKWNVCLEKVDPFSVPFISFGWAFLVASKAEQWVLSTSKCASLPALGKFSLDCEISASSPGKAWQKCL